MLLKTEREPRIKQESDSRDRQEAVNRLGIAARHGRRERTATLADFPRKKKQEKNTMTSNEQRINMLFERLVPESGKADTVAGEIVRAMARIGYRWYNDGDQLGIGYGRETVNPAARYLAKKCSYEVAKTISEAWEIYDETAYEKKLNKIMAAVLIYLDAHPELEQAENTEDMWEYRDEYEDVDRDDEEEENW